jgi:hypothetical protein
MSTRPEHHCDGGPNECPLRAAWAAYDADRWIRSLPAGNFPGTLYEQPTPIPHGRCEACPRREPKLREPRPGTLAEDSQND